VFVRIHDAARGTFVGRFVSPYAQLRFDSAVLPHVTPHLTTVSGLVSMMRNHLGLPTGERQQQQQQRIVVTARIHYRIVPNRDVPWGSMHATVWQIWPLPYGPRNDPCDTLHMTAAWPAFYEDTFLDNESYSDLRPHEAPLWILQASFVDRASMHCRLSVALSLFADALAAAATADKSALSLVTIFRNSQRDMAFSAASGQRASAPGSSATVIGILPEGSVAVAGDALRRLTESRTGLGLFDRGIEKLASMMAVGVDRIRGMVEERIPTTDEAEMIVRDVFHLAGQYAPRSLSTPMLGKGAPPFSLVAFLATALCRIVDRLGGVRTLAMVWTRFIAYIRENHWIPLRPLPSTSDQPDHGACLLHQKLQMLNYCIVRQCERQLYVQQQQHQRLHEEGRRGVSLVAAPSAPAGRGWESDSDDDDFYDSLDAPVDEDSDGVADAPVSSAATSTGSSAAQGEGVSSVHPTLMLLHHDDVPMNVPVVQEPGVETEDMLAEKVQAYLHMGSSREAEAQRARLQSVSLLSDMEAFKAANPLGCLEDFVRWHSPRDWNDGTGDSGHVPLPAEEAEAGLDERLSVRMRRSGNLWIELWREAKPVPVFRQRALFDATREGERVLAWMESLTQARLLEECALPLVGRVLALVRTSAHAHTPAVAQRLAEVDDSGAVVAAAAAGGESSGGIHSRMHDHDSGDRAPGGAGATEMASECASAICEALLASVVPAIAEYEHTESCVRSAAHKLPGFPKLIERLSAGGQVVLEEPAEREAVVKVFEAMMKLGCVSQTMERELLLRCVLKSSNGRGMPQRLYCSVGSEHRLAAAFASDALE
jgi:Rab3 GTPase-activating protein catalytic subunit